MTMKTLLIGKSRAGMGPYCKDSDPFGSVTFHLCGEPHVKAVGGACPAVTLVPGHATSTGLL